MPVYDSDGNEIAREITGDALAEVDGYLLGVINWMKAAQNCLKALQ